MNSEITRREAKNAINEAIHDPEFRRRLRRLDADALAEVGYQKSGGGVEFKVTTATHDTFYLVLGDMSGEPDEGHIEMQYLSQIQGGAPGMGTASSVGSGGTLSSIPVTLSTVGSAGTAGTASSRDE